MVPDAVVELLRARFPGEAVGHFERTFGGYSNLTLGAQIGGRAVVIKAADGALKRADLRHEAEALELLRGRKLFAPLLLALVEDEVWTVEVMDRLAGTNGLSFFKNDPGALEQIYTELGRLLADVHRAEIPHPGAGFEMEQRYRRLLAGLPALGLEAVLLAALAESLEHQAWRPARLRLVHGDAGVHNLLWQNGITALLDWEWAGLGNPLLDLGWIFWTIRLHDAPDQLWQAFLRSYGPWMFPDAPASQEALRALVLGQVALIMSRAHGQSSWQEWLRRAHWTLELEFPRI